MASTDYLPVNQITEIFLKTRSYYRRLIEKRSRLRLLRKRRYGGNDDYEKSILYDYRDKIL